MRDRRWVTRITLAYVVGGIAGGLSILSDLGPATTGIGAAARGVAMAMGVFAVLGGILFLPTSVGLWRERRWGVWSALALHAVVAALAVLGVLVAWVLPLLMNENLDDFGLVVAALAALSGTSVVSAWRMREDV